MGECRGIEQQPASQNCSENMFNKIWLSKFSCNVEINSPFMFPVWHHCVGRFTQYSDSATQHFICALNICRGKWNGDFLPLPFYLSWIYVHVWCAAHAANVLHWHRTWNPSANDESIHILCAASRMLIEFHRNVGLCVVSWSVLQLSFRIFERTTAAYARSGGI